MQNNLILKEIEILNCLDLEVLTNLKTSTMCELIFETWNRRPIKTDLSREIQWNLER